jgi:hypothetical protein
MNRHSAILDPSPAAGGSLPAATDGAPLRSPLRWPAAAAALVAGAAHLPVIPQHLTEVPYIGWLFIGLTAICVVGAAALVLHDSDVAWVVVSSTCLAAVAGYALSRGPGLPGMADDIGDWTNALGLISVVTETSVVLLAVAALRPGPRHRPGSRPGAGVRHRPAARWIPAAAAGMIAVTCLLGRLTT